MLLKISFCVYSKKATHQLSVKCGPGFSTYPKNKNSNYCILCVYGFISNSYTFYRSSMARAHSNKTQNNFIFFKFIFVYEEIDGIQHVFFLFTCRNEYTLKMSNSLLASKCVVRCTLSLVLSEVIDCVHVHWRKLCFSGFKTTT